MSAVSLDNIVDYIVTYIDQFAMNFTKMVYQSLANYMQTPITLAATLFIVCIGYGIAMGHLQADRKILIIPVLKMWFVMTLGLHWDFFCQYFVNVFKETTLALQKAILAAAPVNVPGADSLNSALQVLFNQFYYTGHNLLSTWDPASIVEGILIWLGGLGFVGLGLFEMMLVQLVAAVLFALAPFICIFFLVPFFKSIFDRWLGLLMGILFFNVIIIAILTMCSNMMVSMVPSGGDVGTHPDTTLTAVAFFCSLFVLLLSILFVKKAEAIGMMLGGGVSIGTGTSFLVASISGAAGYAIGKRDQQGDWQSGLIPKMYNHLRNIGSVHHTSSGGGTNDTSKFN